MTEPLDEERELEQRATESEFSGISADSDDLLDDGELREGLINPNTSGGKSKNSGPGMMPPMMMGGAGAGAGAGAQNAMGANTMAAGQVNAANMNAMGAQNAMRSAGGAPGGLGTGTPGMGVPGMGAGMGPGGGSAGVLAAGGESPLGDIPSDWRPGDPILPGDPRHPGGDLGAIFPGDPRYGDLVPGWADGAYGDPSNPSSWNVPTGYNPNDPSTWGGAGTGVSGVMPSGVTPSGGGGSHGGWSYGDPILPGDPRHPGGSGALYPGDPGYDRAAFGGGLGPDGWAGANVPHGVNIPTAPTQGVNTPTAPGMTPGVGAAPGGPGNIPGVGQTPSNGVNAPQQPPTGTGSGVSPADAGNVPSTGQPNYPTAGPTADLSANAGIGASSGTGSGPGSSTASSPRSGTNTSFSVDQAQLREWAKKWQEASDKTAAVQSKMQLPQEFGFIASALPATHTLGGSVIDWSTGASKEFNQIGESLIAAADRYEEQEGFGVRQSNQIRGQ